MAQDQINVSPTVRVVGLALLVLAQLEVALDIRLGRELSLIE